MSKTHRATFSGTFLASEDQGRVTALVSAFEVPYAMPDGRKHLLHSWSFKSVPPQIPVFFQHNHVRAAAPIGYAEPKVKKDGLYVVANFYLDTPEGSSVFRTIKAGAMQEWSIGYAVVQADDDGETLNIQEAELIEVSACMRGANPETRTISVASNDDDPVIQQMLADHEARIAELRADHERRMDAIARGVDPDEPDMETVAAELAAKYRLLDWQADADRKDLLAEADAREARRDEIAEMFAQSRVPLEGPIPTTSLARYAAAGRVGDVTFAVGPYYAADVVAGKAYLASSNPLLGETPYIRPTVLNKTPADVLALVPKTPHEGAGQSKLPIEGSRSGTCGAAPFGTALPTIEVDFTAEEHALGRFGGTITVDRYLLEDAGLAANTINQILVGDLNRSLARDIIAGDGGAEGDGSDGTPIGLVTRLDNPVDATGKNVVDVLAAAVSEIHDAGHTSFALGVVANPATLASVIFGHDDKFTRASLPAITKWVPSPELQDGEVIVGEWSSGCELLVQGVELLTSITHADNFIAGKATLTISLRQFFHVRYLDAFVRIENLGVAS